MGGKLQNLDLPEDEPSLGKMAKMQVITGTFAVSSPLTSPNALQCFSLPLWGAPGFVAIFF